MKEDCIPFYYTKTTTFLKQLLINIKKHSNIELQLISKHLFVLFEVFNMSFLIMSLL